MGFFLYLFILYLSYLKANYSLSLFVCLLFFFKPYMQVKSSQITEVTRGR